MNCPACNDIMYRAEGSTRHTEFLYRFNYHCLNSDCPAKQEIDYTSHMCVIDEQYQSRYSVGFCYEYHLPFKSDGIWYHVVGKQESFNATILRTDDDPKPLIFVEFMPISTIDVSHYGWKLFNRLKNLLVFT